MLTCKMRYPTHHTNNC